MSFRVLKAAESTFMSVFCCSGCSSAYRKDMVMPVLDQWLNEKFLGLPVTWGDDRALTSQLLKLGHKTIYTDQVSAYTIVPENWKQLLTQQLRWKKSWIINAIFTSKFIWKKQPFVAALYYFPLVFVSFMTPFMTVRALFYLPFIKGVAPFFHIIGVMLITALLAVFCRILSKKESYWPYLFLWSLFNLFVLSFILFWAAIKIQDRGWGTR
jgi:hyaluronan synthase